MVQMLVSSSFGCLCSLCYFVSVSLLILPLLVICTLVWQYYTVIVLCFCRSVPLCSLLARLLAPSLTHSLTVEQTGYVQKQLVQKHWLSIPVLMVVLKVLLQSAWAIAHWKIHDLIFRTDSETIQWYTATTHWLVKRSTSSHTFASHDFSPISTSCFFITTFWPSSSFRFVPRIPPSRQVRAPQSAGKYWWKTRRLNKSSKSA